MVTSLSDCDCRRLLRPLEDESLPDHLHWEIAAQNVQLWRIETLEGREADYAGAFYDPITTSDDAVPEEVLDAARWVELPYEWPLPQPDGRYLVLVVRQWVHEKPSETLANLLARDQGWLEAVDRYRDVHERWRAHPAGRGDDDDDIWITKPDRVWRALGADQGDPPDRVLALRLRQRGLPDSPATLRHFRAVVAGRTEPLPARGVLVTTKVVMRGREVERGGIEGLELDMPAAIPTLGNLEHVPGPLLDEAVRVMSQHKRWCREHVATSFDANALTDVGAIRAAQLTAFPARGDQLPHAVDYYAEGVKALPDLLLTLATAPSAGTNRAGSITAYLGKVYRRVRNKHRRSYEKAFARTAMPGAVPPPPEPPEDWRDKIRALVALADDDVLALVRARGGVPTRLTAWLECRAAEIAAQARNSDVTPLGGACA